MGGIQRNAKSNNAIILVVFLKGNRVVALVTIKD